MSSRTENDQYTNEIMTGVFDELLQEADELLTERSQTSTNSLFSRSNTFQSVSASTASDECLETTSTLNLLDLDDLLNESLDLSPISRAPVTSKLKKPVEPVKFSCQHEHKDGWTEFFDQQKFCKVLKAEIQKNFSVETTITKTHDKSPLKYPIYIIEFQSTDKYKVDEARESLHTLFNTVETKVFDEEAGFWVKYPDCIRIIQTYSDQNEHLHILCAHEAIGVMITYFNKDKPTVLVNVCTNDVTLGKIFQEKFSSLDISLPTTSDLTKDNKSYLAQDILKLESEMRSQSILIILEQRRIRLFGLIDLVRSTEKRIKEIEQKYASNTVKLSLEPQQIKYLLDIHSDELKTLESNYQNTKILETFKKGEFTAPKYLHDTIEQKIMSMVTLCTPIQFEIQDEAFCIIAHDERPNLIEIGREYKCQIEIHEETTNHFIEIPKATTQDHVSNKLTAAAIEIHKADLAEQKVDLVVVCSTSMYLCNGILDKAGPSVKQEYAEAAKVSTSKSSETNSGQLKCRKLLFLPWRTEKSNTTAFFQSIRDFVAKAVEHAVKAHHTSVAFPSIGCGQLNVDKNIVAHEMLVEAQKQLLTANVLLQIIFVVLPEQSDVFDAFQAKLENLQKGNVEIEDTQIPYKLTTLTITIVSSNTQKQEECKTAVKSYVKKSVLVFELLQEDVLKKWTQPAINEFYHLCLNKSLVIDMNIRIGYLKVFGSKESVTQATSEYYRIQGKQSEQARLIAVARDIIWAYKIDNSTSEKYSPELNARIEDAYLSKDSSFNYTGDRSDKYTIDFETMMEMCITKQTQREVIRHAGFNLPEHWEVQSHNITQFQVKVNSFEFQEIRALFDKTMSNKYVEIICINRIQNKPWYMQYNSYKSFSSKKDTERQLFHGCPQNSAELIIHSFFNRSFAGVNGTVYGQGAYFSTNANYSHGYAVANTPNGERYMFVAKVLVGDSVLGNTSMKTPPLGFDSTTDGKHIFVTYRDDQAYAAYLIVYK